VRECSPALFSTPSERADREETARFKCYEYDDLIERDKTNLDIFWLKDDSLEDTENLPEPDILASDIVENLGAALEQFRGIQEELEETAAEAEQEATEAA
jgi:type I restriction enzyme M protein